jgi:hypothetical protein
MKALEMALVALSLAVSPSSCRKHTLEIRSDARTYFPISTFGFYTGGFLAVNVTNLTVDGDLDGLVVGFSLDKTSNDAQNPYVETSEGSCILSPERSLMQQEPEEDAILKFTLDFANNRDGSHNSAIESPRSNSGQN